MMALLLRLFAKVMTTNFCRT